MPIAFFLCRRRVLKQMVFFPEMEHMSTNALQMPPKTSPAPLKSKALPSAPPVTMPHTSNASGVEYNATTNGGAGDTDDDMADISDMSCAGRSKNGYGVASAALSLQSKNSAAELANTLEEMRMRFCPSNVIPDDDGSNRTNNINNAYPQVKNNTPNGK